MNFKFIAKYNIILLLRTCYKPKLVEFKIDFIPKENSIDFIKNDS